MIVPREDPGLKMALKFYGKCVFLNIRIEAQRVNATVVGSILTRRIDVIYLFNCSPNKTTCGINFLQLKRKKSMERREGSVKTLRQGIL